MQLKNLSYTWTNLDKVEEALDHINYLDKVSSLNSVTNYKLSTFDLLQLIGNEQVLDVGCGTGSDAIALASRLQPSGQVIGIDISPKMIEHARHNIPDPRLPVYFAVGNAETLNFRSNSFDACRADRVFQHLKHPPRALSEMIRITKPGGRIAISDPDWDSLLVESKLPTITTVLVDIVKSMIQNASMGRQLFALFRDAELASVSIISSTIILTDYAIASEIFLFDKALQAAQESKKLSQTAVHQWLKEQNEKDEAHKFFASITGFAVCGVKP